MIANGKAVLLQRFEDPLLGLAHPVDRPPGGDVGDREGEAVCARSVSAVVADQVDRHDPGTASSQSAQLRVGIWDFSSEPGLVCEPPAASGGHARTRAAYRSWPRSSCT